MDVEEAAPDTPDAVMLPTIADVEAAAGRIRPLAVRTPLLSFPVLDERTGLTVLLKAETLQRTGSFKFRGALNRLLLVPPERRAAGVVACSSGNHAQGVAEAARLLGMPATIVMPADAPAVKRARTERSGARVVPYERNREDRDAIAAAIAAETGATFVHPFDDPAVMAGQGTAGLEIADACRARGLAPDAVLVPASGGGLTAGIALAMEALYPAARVHTVEPAGFDDHMRSLAAGRRVAIVPPGPSLADALLSPAPGVNTFAVNLPRLSGGFAVDEGAMLSAVAFAAMELKLVVEPGGAAGLAALLDGAFPRDGRTVVVVLSGGNVDPAVLARALDGAA